MRKILLLFPACCLSLLLFSLPLIAAASPIDGEADMHVRLAEENYRKGHFDEAIRILDEIVFYYDTENLSAYRLLIKTYKKKGDTAKAKEIEKLYTDAKTVKEARDKGKLRNLTPEQAVKDGLPEERINACAALAEAGDEKNIPLLIEALGDPYFNFYYGRYDVRVAASESLARFGEKAVVPLQNAFASYNEHTRAGALATLARIVETAPSLAPQFSGIYRQALHDPAKSVRMAGLAAAAAAKDRSLLADIAALAGDPDAEIRFSVVTAIEALNPLPDDARKAALKALIPLADDKDKTVVNEVIKVVSETGTEQEITSFLMGIADNDQRDTVARWYAIKGLGEILSGKERSELEKFLASDNFWLKSAAAVALGKKVPEETAGKDLVAREKTISDETALKLSLSAPMVLEEARQAGIDHGLSYLESQQLEDGSFPSYYPLGTTQLAMLCFLREGSAQDYPLIQKGLQYMLKQRRDDGCFYSDVRSEHEEQGKNKISFTTSLAIRVLAALRDPRYSDDIRDAMNWLKSIQNPDGGFGYYKGSRSDITATVFALTGLQAGYDFWGFDKNDEAWLKALDYLKTVQNSDGGFGYSKEENRHSYGSATASGIIALHLAGADTSREGKAMAWVSRNYTWDTNPFDTNTHHYQYYLQELSNALYLSGKDTIPDANGVPHYWFDDISRKLLAEQNKKGSWVSDQEPLFTTYYINILQLKHARISLESM